MSTFYDQLYTKLTPQAQKELLAKLDADAAADAANPLSGYTVAPSTYNVDTATQAPSMPDDLATNAAIRSKTSSIDLQPDRVGKIDFSPSRSM